MTADLKPYPVMKNSSVEWLGEVPAHWQVLPHRAMFSEVKTKEHKCEQMLSVTIAKGVVRQEELLEDTSKKDGARLDKSDYKFVEPGDIAYNKMRAWQGAIGVSRYRGIVSPAYVVQRPQTGVHVHYLHYLLRTPAFAKEAERWSYGIASDMWSLRPEHFKIIVGCLPSLPEQEAIARFLNHMDRLVTRHIEAKEKLVVLLEEYRRVVISDAVTGRIDVRTGKPYPDYKPSGIKWLGEVPSHWGVRRLKSVLDQISEYPSEYRSGIPYISLEQVKSWTGRVTPKKVANVESQLKCFKRGDILFGKLRPYLAKVTRTHSHGLCVGDFFVLRVRNQTLGSFLEYLLRSKPVIDLVNGSTFGARMPRVSWQFMGCIKVVTPPPTEQEAIARFLDTMTNRIQEGIAHVQSEIDLLREYRTRLVSDVVTGKLDVREMALLSETDPFAADDKTDDCLNASNSPTNHCDGRTAQVRH